MSPSSDIGTHLTSERSELRAAALARLFQSGADASPYRQALSACVRDPSEPLRIPALLLLSRMDVPAVDALILGLDPQQPVSVRTVAAALIAGLGPTAAAAVRELCRCLTAEDESLRKAATVALAKIGEPAVPSLRILLQFSNPQPVAAAIEALAMIGRPAAPAAAEIEAAAARFPAGVQLNCAAALCCLTGNPERGLPLLIRALGNSDRLLRAAAAEKIGMLATAAHSAIPNLLQRTQDPEEKVRAAAVLALGRIRAPYSQLLSDLPLRLADPDAEVRYATVVVLASYGAEARSMLPALRACLQDPVEKVAQCAAAAIRKIEESGKGQ
jgi:HEAT repeat protein